MGMEKPLAVNLEIAVPRILLPTKEARSPSSGSEKDEADDTEDVRVVTQGKGEIVEYDVIGDDRRKQQQGISFRVFRARAIDVEKTLLCRVFRGGTITHGLRVTDEVAFKLAVRQAEPSDDTPEHPSLTANTHLVTLYIDAEGIPTTYRIDGAES